MCGNPVESMLQCLNSEQFYCDGVRNIWTSCDHALVLLYCILTIYMLTGFIYPVENLQDEI